MRSPHEEPGTSAGAADTAKTEARATAEQARTAAGEVAGTAQEQAGQVARQAGTEARRVIDTTRGKLADEAQQQTGRVAEGIRQWSDELASMAESAKPDSPVRDAVHQLADGGRRAAEYLDQRGLEGVAGEVQEFARRRPGVFLLGAVAAGFLAGRMAKAAVASAKQENEPRQDRQDWQDRESRAMPPLGAGQEPETFEVDQERTTPPGPTYAPPGGPAGPQVAPPPGAVMPPPVPPPVPPGPVTPPPGRPGGPGGVA